MNAPTSGFNTPLDRRADALIANSYYEASAARPLADDPILDGTLEADVCVIGAGFSGLSVALECRARGLSVIVLDAHRPGWGASGRNGGQTLVGFAKDEIIERQLGLDGARAAWALSVEGVALVRERIARYGIDCDFTPGYLTVATKPKRVPDLRAWMESASQRWGYTKLSLARYRRSTFTRRVATLSGGRLRSVFRASASAQVLPRTRRRSTPRRRATVRAFAGDRSGARRASCRAHGRWRSALPVRRGVRQCDDRRRVARAGGRAHRADRVVHRRHRTARQSARRCADQTGARRSATTTSSSTTSACRQTIACCSADARVRPARRPMQLSDEIRKRMIGVFPQLGDVRIDYAWGGFVDVTRNRAPDFGSIDPNYFYVQGFSGHGVALTGIAGRVVAQQPWPERQRRSICSRDCGMRAFRAARRCVARRWNLG